MDGFYGVIFMILALYLSPKLVFADENDTELSGTLRFHEYERSCSHRRQQGFCRRRSECNRPTRHICRFGLNPIVCCLDQQQLKSTTSSTTQKPVITTKQSIIKPDSIKKIDLTYPGCGFRSPRMEKNTRTSSNVETSRDRGFFSRLGKRSLVVKSFTKRKRRGIQPVIVGGVTAAPNSWPWMVAIFQEISARTPKHFLCGASLISKKYVLSAAHCFDGEKGNIDPSKFFVVVGSHSTKDGTEYPVQKIIIHPDYKYRQYYNDMSLLQIRSEVELTQKVYPVCLPSESLRDKILTNNNNVTVTGWGDTSFGGVRSKYLQEVTVPIVPLKECNNSYSKLLSTSFPKGITNLFICAGIKEGGKDACQGDSGGPLVSKLSDNSYVQLGISSFGYGCAQPGFPGVYTRVSQFTKWLFDNTDLGNV